MTLCKWCGRDEANAKSIGSTQCNPPFIVREHVFDGSHPADVFALKPGEPPKPMQVPRESDEAFLERVIGGDHDGPGGKRQLPELIVTRGDGVPLTDQKAAIREFIETATLPPKPFTIRDKLFFRAGWLAGSSNAAKLERDRMGVHAAFAKLMEELK